MLLLVILFATKLLAQVNIFERRFIQKCKNESKTNYFHRYKLSIVKLKKEFMNKSKKALQRNHENYVEIIIKLKGYLRYETILCHKVALMCN